MHRQIIRNFAAFSRTLMAEQCVYDFKVRDADGAEVSLDKYRGKPLIIVNVASQCGLTNTNYKELKELMDAYKNKGLAVAAFPCNQFGGQEPACELEVKKFVSGKFDFQPDIYGKIDVNGKSEAPLFKYLKKVQGGTLGDAIKWNFTKFLIDERGVPVKRYGPTTPPLSMKSDIDSYYP